MFVDAGVLIDGTESEVNKKGNPIVFRRSKSLCKIKRYSEAVPETVKKVFVHLSFLKFGEVNTLTEKFEADVLVTSRWREPDLDALMDTDKLDTADIDCSLYWNPKLFIENTVGEPVTSSSVTSETDGQGQAWLVERKRFKGTYMETLELWDFPFDVQDLSVFVMSEYANDAVQLLEESREIHKLNRENFIDEQEWYLYEYLESEKSDRAKDPIDPTIKSSTVMVRAKAARRPAYFLFNNFLITFLIVCLSFTIFAVENTLPQNRLQLSFTLILTTVAFKFVVNQSLPKLSYLTYLDRYMLTCMVTLMVLSLWHSISGAFQFEYTVEWIAAICLAGVYVLYNFYFWIRIYSGPYNIRNEMTHKEEDYRMKFKATTKQPEAKQYMQDLRKTLAEFDLEAPFPTHR